MAQEATAAVAPKLIEDAKAPEEAVGTASEERTNIVKNQGGLSMEEWKGIAQTIDPNNTIPSYLKGAAVLGSAYTYFLENGEPEKAAKIARGILITNKQMTQTLGALAQAAVERGDMESAAKLMSDAGNGFPSGQKFDVKTDEAGNVRYSIMEKGEVLKEGTLDTEQFWQMAAKVKDGSMYLEEMGRFATAFGGGGGMSKESALNVVGDAYMAAINAKDAFETAQLTGVEGEELEALRSAASDANSAYVGRRNEALKLGIKRTDIKAFNDEAAAMAIPDAPAEAAEGGGGGFFSGVAGYFADGLDPSKYGETAVTPEGSTVDFNKMPAPQSKAERDALPAGTRYIAPNGEVKVKK